MSLRRAALLGCALALAAAPVGAAPADPAANAAANAQRLLASIEGRPCPAFGDRSYVGGTTGPEQIAAAEQREIAFARQSMRTLDRLVADPEVSATARGTLSGLGSWTVAQSLANWTLLRLAQQAATDPRVAPGQPFPTDPSGATQDTLAQFAAARALVPDAAMLIGRLRDATARCAASAREAVIAANDPAIRAAIDGARSPDDLRRVESLYQLRQGSGEGRTALIALWDQRMRAVTPRVARAPAAPPPAAASGPSQAQLATATRFVAAANRQNKAAALAELTDDVQLVTPNGRYAGKAEVSQAVAQQSSRGGTGGLSAPRISGGRIVSSGRASGFNVVTVFEFSGTRISRMVVGLA